MPRFIYRYIYMKQSGILSLCSKTLFLQYMMRTFHQQLEDQGKKDIFRDQIKTESNLIITGLKSSLWPIFPSSCVVLAFFSLRHFWRRISWSTRAVGGDCTVHICSCHMDTAVVDVAAKFLADKMICICFSLLIFR